MPGPFKQHKKKRKFISAIDIDSWLNDGFYRLIIWLKAFYMRLRRFFGFFSVRGVPRFFVEITSDIISFVLIGFVLVLSLTMPAFHTASSTDWRTPHDFFVTFLDVHGKFIGERGPRYDDTAKLEDMPVYLIQALLATEDRRFYDHFGVDIMGTFRAMVINAQTGSMAQGGSTLTQQLVKNLFVGNERTLLRKINEAIISLWLEARLTKNQILKLYLDRTYFGGGNMGVAAASQFYFNKKVNELNLQEAAMLAGLPKAPSKYAPHIDIGAARARANEVLANLVEANFMTDSQLVEARQNPANIVEFPKKYSPDYFLDWAYDEVSAKARPLTKMRKVIAKTTINVPLQRMAEELVRKIYLSRGLRDRFDQIALVSMDPDGAVRTMIGGVDGYEKSQFNRSVHALRQPGSSFKIFPYALALQEGMTPGTVMRDKKVCYGSAPNVWCPNNYSRRYYGNTTLLNALTHSYNTIPVQLSMKYSLKRVAALAKEMGVSTKINLYPSMALGASGVRVVDMANAYAIFANGGYQVKAHGVERIIDGLGKVIYEAKPITSSSKRLFSDRVVKGMNRMLHNVVMGGTGGRANLGWIPTAGKTGTTQAHHDAWFVGFTGNQVAAVWVGNENNTPTRKITGGKLPSIIWRRYMASAHRNMKIKGIPGLYYRYKRPEGEGNEPIAQVNFSDAINQRTTLIIRDIRDALKAAPNLSPISSIPTSTGRSPS